MKCLKIYESQGRFQMAGKIMKQMGEEAEGDMDYENAIFYYRKGADYFAMENSNSKSYEQGCLIKLADLMCLTDHADAARDAKQVEIYIFIFLDIRKNCISVSYCSSIKIKRKRFIF